MPLVRIDQKIIEPIAYEQEAKDIDSTDDMLNLITKLNARIKESKELHSNVPCVDQRNSLSDSCSVSSANSEVLQGMMKDLSENQRVSQDMMNSKYEPGDIRNFGK